MPQQSDTNPPGTIPQLCAECACAYLYWCSRCSAARQAPSRLLPLILGTLTHSHTDQRSPRADKSSGRERSEGESHAGNAKYLLSALLFFSPPSSSDAAARVLEGCGVWNECKRERQPEERKTYMTDKQRRAEQSRVEQPSRPLSRGSAVKHRCQSSDYVSR